MAADKNLDEILASIRKIVVEDPQAAAPDIDDALLDPDFDSEPLPGQVEAMSAAAAAPVAAGAPPSEATIDAAARALLAPLLKAWIDANLAEIVETAVAAEIARLTGRA